MASAYRGREAAGRLQPTSLRCGRPWRARGGCVAALERILERGGLDAAATASKGPTAEEYLTEVPRLRELIAGLELSTRYGSSENTGSARNLWVWHQSTELDKKATMLRQRQPRVGLTFIPPDQQLALAAM